MFPTKSRKRLVHSQRTEGRWNGVSGRDRKYFTDTATRLLVCEWLFVLVRNYDDFYCHLTKIPSCSFNLDNPLRHRIRTWSLCICNLSHMTMSNLMITCLIKVQGSETSHWNDKEVKRHKSTVFIDATAICKDRFYCHWNIQFYRNEWCLPLLIYLHFFLYSF